jgi:AcrR family transcriptional regulator
MQLSSRTDLQAGGLRERKKAKTRAAMQQHALRLFREQGYDATTVEQIAAAAEVSPSTFFRYFPSKEDVALYDALDPLIIAAFEAQPPKLSPIQAFRRAMHEVFDELPPEELLSMQDRFEIIREVPELRARMLQEFTRSIQLAADLIAGRLGRPADDFAVRTFAGALVGVAMAAMLDTDDELAGDFLERLDAGMAQLEAGLPL